MNEMKLSKQIFLYRMTHIRNVEHIFKFGITHIDSPQKNKNYVPIGDASLISARYNRLLPNGKTL